MSVKSEIEKARELRKHIIEQCGDDPDLIADMIEAETSINDLIEWALRKFADEKTFESAIKERVDQLQARKKAAERRQDKLRDLIGTLLTESGQNQYKGVEGTVSFKTVPPKPIIQDELQVPPEYCKLSVDKTAINQAYKNGMNVPGCTLDNGGTTLMIRS
jgi:hypothetical protein